MAEDVKFIPRGGYLSIIRDDNREQVFEGGVVGINLQPSQTGVIQNVGNEVPTEELCPGERVLFSRIEGFEFPIGRETLVILHYKQVFGKLTVEAQDNGC